MDKPRRLAPGLIEAMPAGRDALDCLLGAALPGAQPELVASVGLHFRRHEQPKGSALLRQAEIWRHALLIEQGLIRLYFVRRDGREFNKNFYADGALVCPLTPAMWDEPSLFAIAAIEPTVVWRADASAFRQALGSVWEPLQRELLARLVTHKLQREHNLLALTGSQRYLAFCRDQPRLARRIPLGHLATYLGLTDVSLSHIRRNLRGADHL